MKFVFILSRNEWFNNNNKKGSMRTNFGLNKMAV